MNRIFIDSVLYWQDALEFAAKVWGEDNVLFGTDYPHNIGDAAGCLGRVNAFRSLCATRCAELTR